MLIAQFATRAEAEAHRKPNGGWLFVPEADTRVWWFAPSFTPTTVFMHTALRGVSGKLM